MLKLAAAVSSERLQPQPLSAVRFQFASATEVAARKPQPWRVDGLLPTEGIAAIYGPPGSGKSFLALDLLAAIAAGSSWFEHKCYPAPAVLVTLEGSGGLVQRVRALCETSSRLDGLQFLSEPIDLRNDARPLGRAVRAAGFSGGVLAIDTLSRAFPGIDENAPSDMGRAVECLEVLRAEIHGLVVVVHHAGKDAQRGPRGHSSLLAALDAAIEVRRDGSGRTWKVGKAKDSPDGATHGFSLKPRGASCVVRPVQAAAHRADRLPVGTNQRAALRALEALAAHSAPPWPESVAIEAIASSLTCEPKRKRERALAAFRGLTEAGLVSVGPLGVEP